MDTKKKMATETKKRRPYQLILDNELLDTALEKAKSEGLMLSQVIRRFLIDYVSNPQGKLFH